jgi:hypothetical protein
MAPVYATTLPTLNQIGNVSVYADACIFKNKLIDVFDISRLKSWIPIPTHAPCQVLNDLSEFVDADLPNLRAQICDSMWPYLTVTLEDSLAIMT